MNKRLNLRIALILLMLTLVVIVPVYAQDTTPEATSTVEVTATTEATVAPTEEVTVEAGVLPTEVPPESRPVAGVPETPTEQLSSSGVVILVLLVGLAAIGATAFSALMRGRKFTPPQ